MAEALIRILHLLGAAGLAAGVVIAILAVSSINRTDVEDTGPAASDADQDAEYNAVARVYIYTLLAALVTLSGGLALWLLVGKPAAFFSNNPVFHAKMALFVILLGLLAWPAWYFLSHKNVSCPQPAEVPSAVVRLQKAALPVLLIIPVLAYLMARGIGY